jgi:hypothetical protein
VQEISQPFLPTGPYRERFCRTRVVRITTMKFDVLDEAAELLDKANANLEPELLSADGARKAA